MTISFGQVASDVTAAHVFESLQSVPNDQIRMLVRCDHQGKGATRVAKVIGDLIRTQYMEDDYPGAPHEWVHMDCERCLRSWKVSKARLREVIEGGAKEIVVRKLTDQWTRLPRLEKP